MATATLAGVAIGDGQPIRVMAAINVSPESFYAGSIHADGPALRDAVQRAVGEGADFIDIGAMSTAPYLQTHVPVEEEVRRMTWALRTVAAAVSVPLSADTTRATVAAAAIANGARIINDVTGLRTDPAMADIAAMADGVVLAAAPVGAGAAPPLALIRQLWTESLERARAAGIPPEHIVLDPAIGFFVQAGVRPEVFNCIVLAGLCELADLGRPLLVGVSRKSFIGKITGGAGTADRLWGSLAATAIAVYNGAALVRTHDVAATRDVVRVAAAIRRGGAD